MKRFTLATPLPATGIVHDTDRRQFLRHVQTDIVGHRTASDGETTGQQRPERGTIGNSASRRDYLMSTHDVGTRAGISGRGR